MTTAPVLSACAELSSSQIKELDSVANRIRALTKKTTETILEIGNELISAKNALPHGHFVAWVQEKCGFSPKTAQRFISAAKFAADKSDSVSLLQPNTVYRLAAKSAPSQVVGAVVERGEAGQPLTDNDVIVMLDEDRQRRRMQKDKAEQKSSASAGRNPLLAAWRVATADQREEVISTFRLEVGWLISDEPDRRDFVRDCARQLGLGHDDRKHDAARDGSVPTADTTRIPPPANEDTPIKCATRSGASPPPLVPRHAIPNAAVLPTPEVDYTCDSPGRPNGIPNFLRRENVAI